MLTLMSRRLKQLSYYQKKVDSKKKNFTRDREGHFLMKKVK